MKNGHAREIRLVIYYKYFTHLYSSIWKVVQCVNRSVSIMQINLDFTCLRLLKLCNTSKHEKKRCLKLQ